MLTRAAEARQGGGGNLTTYFAKETQGRSSFLKLTVEASHGKHDLTETATTIPDTVPGDEHWLSQETRWLRPSHYCLGKQIHIAEPEI